MKGNTDRIPSFSTPWEGYSKSSVEEHIKSRLEALELLPDQLRGITKAFSTYTDDEGGATLLVGFASDADKASWEASDVRLEELELWALPLPQGSGQAQGTVRRLTLASATPPSATIAVTEGSFAPMLCFLVKETDTAAAVSSYLSESGTLAVERRGSASEAWAPAGSLQIVSAAAPGEYAAVDLSAMLADGRQQLRVRVTNADDERTGWVTFTDIVKTSVSLSYASAWQRPLAQAGDSSVRLRFGIAGQLEKQLHVALGGSEYTSTPGSLATYAEIAIELPQGSAFTAGVQQFSAWLTFAGGQTTPLAGRFMVGGGSEAAVVVNGVPSAAENFSTDHICSLALWSPDGSGRPVAVTLEDAASEVLCTLNAALALEPGEACDVAGQIDIPHDMFPAAGGADFRSLDAWLHVRDAATGADLAEPVAIALTSTEAYTPPAGEEFSLSPGKHTNASRDAVCNDTTGAAANSAAQFAGTSFTAADGWTTGLGGAPCLRVLSGDTVTVPFSDAFRPFAALDEGGSGELAIELDVAVRNIADFSARALVIGPEAATHGLELLPTAVQYTQGAGMTEEQQLDCRAGFAEGERTHIVLSLIKTAEGLDVVRIYINGIISREMQRSAATAFPAGAMVIGSTGADVEIYGMRAYGIALDHPQVRQLYVASLPTMAQKRSVVEANDIYSEGAIVYSRAKARYACLLLDAADGTLPRKAVGTEDTDSATPAAMTLTLPDDGIEVKTAAMPWQGQGTSSMSYWDWNLQSKGASATLAAASVKTLTGADAAPQPLSPLWWLLAADKICLKINWASPQQSHKMGACNLHNDLYHDLVEGAAADIRTAVPQMPVMVFYTEGGVTRYMGLGTFGPAKGDAHTFGLLTEGKDRALGYTPLVMEGCDNGTALTKRLIPWDSAVTSADGKNKVFGPGGAKHWEVCMGSATTAYTTAAGVEKTTIGRFAEIHNWVYMHRHDIVAFEGDKAALDASTDPALRSHLAVCSDAMLFRHDGSAWVGAGLDGAPLAFADQTGSAADGLTAAQLAEAWKAWRVADFAAGFASRFRADAALFEKQFCLLIAAKDNRAKNKYERLTWSEAVGDYVVDYMQDDLDTIFSTNNVGRLNAPYWVEEHDSSATGTYWNAPDNALFNLMEAAFPAQLRQTMFSILDAMAVRSGSAMACMEEYFFSTQRYFSIVAYNEQARLRYERAALDTSYVNGTPPLSQSLGSQLESERQWVQLRLFYLSSYCEYGIFRAGENGSGALQFRSVMVGSEAPAYDFALTAALAFYPSASVGQQPNVFAGGSAVPVRVMEGEAFSLAIAEGTDNDTNVYIRGIDAVSGIGDMGACALGGTFIVGGARLRAFAATAAGSGDPAFAPSKVQLAAPCLRSVDLRGCTAVGSVESQAGTDIWNLRSVDLRGSSVTSLALASMGKLESVQLGAYATEVAVADAPNLTVLSVEGASRLASLAVERCPALDSSALVRTVLGSAADGAPKLASVRLPQVDWTALGGWITPAQAARLVSLGAELSGRVTIGGAVGFDLKLVLIRAWGDIDSESNTLYASGYPLVEITDEGAPVINARIGYFPTGSSAQMLPQAVDTAFNGFRALEWSLEDVAEGCSASIDPLSGLLAVQQGGDADSAPQATVVMSLTLADGSVRRITTAVGLYERACREGDMVYADGSFSDRIDPTKTVVGACFYVNPDHPERRLALCTRNLGKWAWGVSLSSSEGLPDLALREDAVVPDDMAAYSYNGVFNPYVVAQNDGISAALDDNPVTTCSQELPGFVPMSPIWLGRLRSLQIIKHRDFIISSIDSDIDVPPVPDGCTTAQLTALMDDIAAAGGNAKYKQLYYPAASMCLAYEPEVAEGEQLAGAFARGKWWLPSPDELVKAWQQCKDGIFAAAIAAGKMESLYNASTNNQMRTSTNPVAKGNGEYAYGVEQLGGNAGLPSNHKHLLNLVYAITDF